MKRKAVKALVTRIEQAKANNEMVECGCECHKGVSITHFIECCKHIDKQPIDLRTLDDTVVQ
ncbi:hypothetical protein VPHD528_0098 [Vibrio phage D528]